MFLTLITLLFVWFLVALATLFFVPDTDETWEALDKPTYKRRLFAIAVYPLVVLSVLWALVAGPKRERLEAWRNLVSATHCAFGANTAEGL